MKNYTIDYRDNSIEIQTDFGSVKLGLGRPSTVADAETIEAMISLGARMYAEEIRQARLVVDDLINWRTS